MVLRFPPAFPAVARFGQLRVLAAFCLVRAVRSAILGVAPADEAKYTGADFKCFDGSGATLSPQSINDGFCDCSDGSDEPGTGACAGQDKTLFYCANEGSTPRLLYVSRVGDGICDCCDGSDEAELEKRRPGLGRETQTSWMGLKSAPFSCINTCAEQGKREEAERKARVELVKQGIAKKEESRKNALVQREKREADIKQFEVELVGLEEALKVATAAADVEREAEKAAKEKAEAARLAANAEKCSKVAPNCMWRQTGACKPDGTREAEFDKVCTSPITRGSSGFCDCDGNGEKGETESGYDCTGPERDCCSACSSPQVADGGNKVASAEEAGEAEVVEEAPQVSEYSKWMDGAEEKLADTGEEKPQVSEYSKWMDGAEEKLADAQEAETETKAESEAGAAPAAEEKQKTAIELENDARSKVNDMKRSIERLQDENAALPDEYLGYAGLEEKQISKKVGEHDYKISFFKDAKQGYTSLGNWDGFVGPFKALFKHGTRCWDGPERELHVSFECGAEAQILDVIEPSKCVYEATVVSPGACDSSELERYSGVQVVGPKEEL